jgi:putative ABC transport system permease protein
MQTNVRKGFEAFEMDIVQISKWPLDPTEDVIENGGVYKWWEYLKRPSTTFNEYKFVKSNTTLGKDITFIINLSGTVKYQRNSINNAAITCATLNYDKIAKIELEYGRFFSAEEDNSGTAVAIIGGALKEELFKDRNPIGESIKVNGYSATVIGVTKKAGESMVNSPFSSDESVVIPLNFGQRMVNIRTANNTIYGRPKDGVEQSDLENELKLLMRLVRRLSPTQKNNFSVGSFSFFEELIGEIFGSISVIGWIIAGFSLLIGGFGIANIMFVSVKERTNIIGIQKALGAKKYVIMSQFLVEAVLLAIAGGLVGISLVLLIVLLLPPIEGFVLTLSVSNIMSGVAISSVIGILSGLIPAWVAANLNPVDAINS